MLLKKILCLLLSIGLLMASLIFNSFISINRDKTVLFTNNDIVYKLKYPRVEGEEQALLQFSIDNRDVSPVVRYKAENLSSDSLVMKKFGDNFVSLIPAFKAGSKVNYYVDFGSGKLNPDVSAENPMTLMYRNNMPLFIQIFLIALYYGALFFLILNLLYRVFKFPSYKHIGLHLYKAFVLLLVVALALSYYMYGVIWNNYPVVTDINLLKILLITVFAWVDRFFIDSLFTKIRQPQLYLLIFIILVNLFPVIWIL